MLPLLAFCLALVFIFEHLDKWEDDFKINNSVSDTCLGERVLSLTLPALSAGSPGPWLQALALLLANSLSSPISPL